MFEQLLSQYQSFAEIQLTKGRRELTEEDERPAAKYLCGFARGFFMCQHLYLAWRGWLLGKVQAARHATQEWVY